MEVKFIVAEKSEVNEVEQSVIGWGSKPTPDRDKELIEAEAWRLDTFKSNPVLMLSHDYSSPPIGKVLWVKADGTGLKFKARFAQSERGREIYELYKDGIMNAFSVGFSPKKVDTQPDKDIKYKGMNLKKVFKEVDLLEISCVSIPANSQALVEYVKSGKIRTKALQEEFDNIIEIIESKNIEETDDLEIIDSIESEEIKSTEEVKEENTPVEKTEETMIEKKEDETDDIEKEIEEVKAIEEEEVDDEESDGDDEEKGYSDWMETDEEEVYIVRDAEDFDIDTLRIVSLKKYSPCIKAMMGESLEDGKIEIQSLMFPKEEWTQEESAGWLAEHSIKSFNIAFETLSEDISDVLVDFKESIIAEVKGMVNDGIETKKLDINGAPSVNDIRNAIQRVIEESYPPIPSSSEIATMPLTSNTPKISRYMVDFYPIEYPNGSCIISVYTYDNVSGISSDSKYYRQPYTYSDGIATFGQSEIVEEAWILKKYEGTIEKFFEGKEKEEEEDFEIEEKSVDEEIEFIDSEKEEDDGLVEVDSDSLQKAIKDVFLNFNKEDIIKNTSIKEIAQDAIDKARGRVIKK